MSGRIAASALALALAGCRARSPAPEAWRRTMDEAIRSPHGAWTSVALRTGAFVTGELIAVDDRAVWVGAGAWLQEVPLGCVNQLGVVAFDGSIGGTAAWSSLGAISTLSHGYFLVFSLPAWGLASLVSSRAASRAGHLTYGGSGNQPPSAAGTWGRFPQGLPPGYAGRAVTHVRYGAACFPGQAPPRPDGGPPG